jgi:hypothetical protein
MQPTTRLEQGCARAHPPRCEEDHRIHRSCAADVYFVRRATEEIQITTGQTAFVEFRKRQGLVLALTSAAIGILSIGGYNWVQADRDSPSQAASSGFRLGNVLYWLLTLWLSGALIYLALRASRFRMDRSGVYEWHWTGVRSLRWTEVTRCYLLREGSMSFIVLCRGDERWKLPAAAFQYPDRVFDFVDSQLPPSASRRPDA